jgi:hypothetical protein
MKILILVPIWQRPEVTKLWTDGMKWFKTENISILTILSHEDKFFNENLDLIHKYSFDYCIFFNNPLGRKLNAGIEYALENFDFDYLMNLGSDDLIHPGILCLYDVLMKNREQFFGLDKVYFYDKLTRRLALSKPMLWGAGRMINRDLLDMMKNKKEFIYNNGFNRGLDCNSIEKIKTLLGIDYKQVETNDFPYLVDIKTETGLNDFTLQLRFCDLVDSNILRQYYPENLIRQIYGRKNTEN